MDVRCQMSDVRCQMSDVRCPWSVNEGRGVIVMNTGKPLIAQLYAARARHHWATGNRQLAEELWLEAKVRWYAWKFNRQE